jgi:hypothetical protein
MLNLDPTTLSDIADQTMQQAARHPRWLAAIKRAVCDPVENPYIARQDNYLLIPSSSDKIYPANGVCQCEAFQRGFPCWHCAAARLVRSPSRAQICALVRPKAAASASNAANSSVASPA